MFENIMEELFAYNNESY